MEDEIAAEAAMIEAEPAGEAWPADVAALITSARRLYRAKRYREAADTAGQAIALLPDDVDLWNTRGVFLRAGGQSAEAVWCYREVIRRQPDNPGAWSNLGNALKDLKQLDSAIACHRHAIDMRPEDPGFHRNLALALMAGRRHREALSSLEKALRLAPGDPSIRFDRSMAHLHLGE